MAVLGLAGLGHMAVKLATSMGAEVTVLSTSPAKEADARRLGAHEFALTSDRAIFDRFSRRFDLILDTASAPHDLNGHLGMLRVDGTLVLLGVPAKPMLLNASPLIGGRRTLAGSLIGGIAETQEMLDYCAAREIRADVEVVPIQKINEIYERMVSGDVRYRFVIDLSTL